MNNSFQITVDGASVTLEKTNADGEHEIHDVEALDIDHLRDIIYEFTGIGLEE